MFRSGRSANLLLMLASTVVALFAAEWVFRSVLFWGGPTFTSLRNAGNYADSFNDADYWKLYYLFGGEFGPPQEPHPLLGWIGAFKRKSLMHDRIDEVGDARPALLYGDSYAQCMPGVICFQDLLNTDSTFARDHYLLNYGVGGFGVDQIALLFENTYWRYERPVVVFSLMATDLDRTPMDWRTGQKPYFSMQGDSLRLNGVPIDPDPGHYIAGHGVGIKSYLWRRFLFSKANFLPDDWTNRLKGKDAAIREKVELNGRILDRVLRRLRDDRIDFFFVVFHYLTPDQPEFHVDHEDNWRDRFLRSFLDERDVPYIWSKEVIKNDTAWTGDNLDKYMILDNGHPTTYLNRLIAAEMKRRVLALAPPAPMERPGPPRLSYVQQMEEIEGHIRADSTWLDSTRVHAAREGRTLDHQVRMEAWWMLEDGSTNVEDAIKRYIAP